MSDPTALLAMAEAQFSLGMATLKLLRESLAVPVAPPVFVSPDRCKGIDACGLSDVDSRIDKTTFGSQVWKCVGCGHTERAA